MLDKEFNFIGSQGTVTEAGCRPSSNTCPNAGGQDAINGASWCTSGGYPSVTVTYDKAGTTFIDVKSNKSLVGKGSAGVIRGIGLRIANGASNVIIQNVHITQLNPQYIWGGDAITLAGSDMVWIDHCKFSLIGRQMLVTGYAQAGRVTVSNNEFDGATSWSATCNGDHYWTMLFLGSSDLVTLVGNHIHDVSGRAPKIGGASTANTMVHAVNNYFHSMGGHAFDISTGGMALIEGNVFESVTTVITAASSSAGGRIFNTYASGNQATCSSGLGRSCILNTVSSVGGWSSYATSDFLANFSGKNVQAAIAVASVKASVQANAGIGHIGN
ncbi:pectin lyase fold/virulence factor [Geopyxis carbonaria]|nr:pectin lyase fold/virulence factor [Geopyxis carbonaria]